MPYDITKYEPGYGGLIDSSGNVKNVADGITANGSTIVLGSVTNGSDNVVVSANNQNVINYPMLYNGTTFDTQRGNQSYTGLASAARTSTTTTADITNHNARGLVIWLNVTAAPAAPSSYGLKVLVFAKSKNGIVKGINAPASTPLVQSTVVQTYAFYAGAGTSSYNFNLVTGGALPRTLYIEVNHSDAQSYTYSLDYDLIM